jgi:hypothetical protein
MAVGPGESRGASCTHALGRGPDSTLGSACAPAGLTHLLQRRYTVLSRGRLSGGDPRGAPGLTGSQDIQ